MRFKHKRDQARGMRDRLVFAVEGDRWGSLTLSASVDGRVVGSVDGLRGEPAVRAAERRLTAQYVRSLKG